MLLTDPDGVSWLLVAGRRHRIDTGDSRLLAAYGLVRAPSRQVSGALLAVLPEGPELRTPAVPGRGAPAPAGVPGRIGDVLAARPVGGPAQYFVVLTGGLQQVSPLVAELLRVGSVARAFRSVPLDVVAAAAAVDELPVAGWPPRRPADLDGRAGRAALLVLVSRRSARGSGVGGRRAAAAGRDRSGRAGSGGRGGFAGGRGGRGCRRGGARRGGRAGAGSGLVWLISASGVGHPVLDPQTAAAIGVTSPEPAPAAVLPLLPAGPEIDLRSAGLLLDTPTPP